MYLNNELLNLAQALEAYHRKIMNNTELPINQHQKRVNEIVRLSPDEHRDWLKNKLKYSNEPILRKRLKELWERCPEAISSRLGTKNEFVGVTVDTRNYLTHFGEDLKANAATGQKLYELVMKLRILMQVCLLQALEFNNNDVERLMLKPLGPVDQLPKIEFLI
jgi:hypothetical protein